ncbi:TPA: hypothetical protein ACVU43_003006 [Vibrio parahaemolyticus]|nr:hypothetical protein [Vibrio parahaemolyticus]
MTDKIIKQLEDEINLLKKTIYELHKEVITHRQYFKQRADGEVSGYTTIPNLIPATAEQVERGNLLVIETSDGTKRAYLSELLGKLVAEDIPDLDASKITTGTLNSGQLPTIPVTNIPAAVNSATSGSGFGGYRYTVSGTTLNLFTS